MSSLFCAAAIFRILSQQRRWFLHWNFYLRWARRINKSSSIAKKDVAIEFWRSIFNLASVDSAPIVTRCSQVFKLVERWFSNISNNWKIGDVYWWAFDESNFAWRSHNTCNDGWAITKEVEEKCRFNLLHSIQIWCHSFLRVKYSTDTLLRWLKVFNCLLVGKIHWSLWTLRSYTV